MRTLRISNSFRHGDPCGGGSAHNEDSGLDRREIGLWLSTAWAATRRKERASSSRQFARYRPRDEFERVHCRGADPAERR